MQAPWQPEVESQPNHIGIPEVRTSSYFWPHSTGDSQVADGPPAARYRDDKSEMLVDVVNQTHQPLVRGDTCLVERTGFANVRMALW